MSDRQRWIGSIDEEALQSDAYLESLLAAHARSSRPTDVAAEERHRLAPEVRLVADLLERALPRFHPSFRFEESLAERLRAAAHLRQPGVGGDTILAFPPPARRDTTADEPIDGSRPRGLLLGGAIASGVSLAGAAFLVWRRARRPH